jgi:hypothetical protein
VGARESVASSLALLLLRNFLLALQTVSYKYIILFLRWKERSGGIQHSERTKIHFTQTTRYMWWTKKAYNLWRFVGGYITEAWRTLFPQLIPVSSNFDAASTKVEFSNWLEHQYYA